MKPKPRIYKDEDGWSVDLPAFGFAPTRTRSGFASWSAAGGWLAQQGNGGSGAQHLERADRVGDRYRRVDGWPLVIR